MFAAQCGNQQMSAEYIVQMLLFGAVIFAVARDLEPERRIERDAFGGVVDDDCRVINAKK